MTPLYHSLAELGLEKYAERLDAEEIDLEALRLLDDADLQSLGLSLGPRRKLLAAIAKATGGPAPDTVEPGVRQSTGRSSAARPEMAGHVRRVLQAGAASDGELRIVGDLVERGVLAGTRGARCLVQPDSSVRLPDSLQAVIRARIDRLEPEHKRLLQVASVIGRTVPYDLLDAVAERSDVQLRDAITALEAGEFLFQTQTLPEYLIKHALTEHVAYESLLRRQRRTLHAAVLRAIERLRATRPDEQVEALAHHATHAEQWPEAARYLRRAGNKAVGNSAYREAVAHFDSAIDAVSKLPSTHEHHRHALDVRQEMRAALGALGQYEQIRRRMGEARDLARTLGETERETAIAADSIHVRYHTGHLREALDTGNDVLRRAEMQSDRRNCVLAASNYAQAHFMTGNFQRALAIAEPYAPLLRTEFRHERIASTATSACIWLGNLSGTHAMLGQFEQAIEAAEEACCIAGETGLPFDRVMADNWLTWTLNVRGDGERALAVTDANAAMMATNDLEFLVPWRTMGRAYALVLNGRADEALVLFDVDRTSVPRLTDLVLMTIWSRTIEALALESSGDAVRAAALATDLLEQSRTTGALFLEPLLLRTLARLAVRSGAPEQAREHLLLARTVAEGRGERPESAQAALALARADADLGLEDERREAARAAHDLFALMGMSQLRVEAQALLYP